MDQAASAAVAARPSGNFRSPRSLKFKVSPSGEVDQLSAAAGMTREMSFGS